MLVDFLTAVDIRNGGEIDFVVERAALTQSLRSRAFGGLCCVSVHNARQITYKGECSHFWVDGQIDASPNVQFVITMTVRGPGYGWYVINGVQYPADGRARGFTTRELSPGGSVRIELAGDTQSPEFASKEYTRT